MMATFFNTKEKQINKAVRDKLAELQVTQQQIEQTERIQSTLTSLKSVFNYSFNAKGEWRTSCIWTGEQSTEADVSRIFIAHLVAAAMQSVRGSLPTIKNLPAPQTRSEAHPGVTIVSSTGEFDETQLYTELEGQFGRNRLVLDSREKLESADTSVQRFKVVFSAQLGERSDILIQLREFWSDQTKLRQELKKHFENEIKGFSSANTLLAKKLFASEELYWAESDKNMKALLKSLQELDTGDETTIKFFNNDATGEAKFIRDRFDEKAFREFVVSILLTNEQTFAKDIATLQGKTLMKLTRVQTKGSQPKQQPKAPAAAAQKSILRNRAKTTLIKFEKWEQVFLLARYSAKQDYFKPNDTIDLEKAASWLSETIKKTGIRAIKDDADDDAVSVDDLFGSSDDATDDEAEEAEAAGP